TSDRRLRRPLLYPLSYERETWQGGYCATACAHFRIGRLFYRQVRAQQADFVSSPSIEMMCLDPLLRHDFRVVMFDADALIHFLQVGGGELRRNGIECLANSGGQYGLAHHRQNVLRGDELFVVLEQYPATIGNDALGGEH